MTRPILAPALALMLTGCTMGPVPVPTVSVKAVNVISEARIAPMRVGEFRLAKNIPPERDRSLAVRAATIHPEGGSFSHYLGETLKQQLAAAGRLDDHSDTVISGEIVSTDVGSAIGANSGHGVLAVEFRINRGDAELFRKVIKAEGNWNSSLIGGVAIPAAERGYMALYPEVVAQLFADLDLRRVAGR